MSGPAKPRPASKAQLIGVSVLMVAMWIGAFFTPNPEGRKPLAVAVGIWPGAEPFIMAREAGELPRESINMIEMNWSSAAMRAVGNRVVDATVLSLDEVVRQMGQGYPLRIVMVTDISRGADAVVSRTSISDVKQLAGLRVGYEPRTAGFVMLARCLREAGLKVEDVQEVPLNPAEAEETFDDLMLDAVAISEPWVDRIDSPDLKILYDSSRPGAEVVRVLAVHKDTLKLHNEEIKALVEAHLKWMPILRTLQTGLDPVLRREGIDAQTFHEIVQKLEVPSREQNIQWLSGGDPWLRQKMRMLAREIGIPETGQLTHLDEVLDPEFVKQTP